MLRKVLMLAITTGVASKLYRSYRQKHPEMGSASAGRAQNGGAPKTTMTQPQPGSSGAGMEV